MPVSFLFVAELFTPCLSIEIFIFVLMLTDFYALLPDFNGVSVLHTDIKYWLLCAISTVSVKVWSCLPAPLKNNKQIAEEDHALFPWFDWRQKFLIDVKRWGFWFYDKVGCFSNWTLSESLIIVFSHEDTKSG